MAVTTLICLADPSTLKPSYFFDAMVVLLLSMALLMRVGRWNAGVQESLWGYAPQADDCLHTLRIKLLVLLDMDETTRRRLCEYKSPVARVASGLPLEGHPLLQRGSGNGIFGRE